MNIRSATLLLSFSFAPAFAQDLAIKAPPQERAIAITNATIHPISGPAIENGHIIFSGGIITNVGPGPAILSGEADVIDAAGKHVWPGLITPVSQLGLTEVDSVRATLDYNEVGEFTPEVRAAVAVNPDSTLLPVTRSAGILAFAAFPTGGRIPGRVSVMNMDGWTWESMTIADDAGLVLSWPRMHPSQDWWQSREGDQEKRTREQLDEIDRFFDAAEAYFIARAADPARPTDLRFEAMRSIYAAEVAPRAKASSEKDTTERDARQRPIFILANDADQISAAVNWCARRSLRCVIVGGRDAMLCRDLLLQHDVPVIITGVHEFPKRSDSNFDGTFTLPAQLEKAGIRWTLAPSAGPDQQRNLALEMGRAVAYGLDRDDAHRALTLGAAAILGVDNRIGSLEPGKSATLIITDGDPVETLTRVERAFIDGRSIDLANKQTDLANKYREKYRQMGLIPAGK